MLDLLDNTLTDNELDIEASMIDVDGREGAAVDDELTKLSLHKPVVRQGNRPKSAGFLKRLAEKNKNDDNETGSPSLVASAQSLCDLRGITAMSSDDIELMRSEMSREIHSPVSPSSEAGEDVYTPCGSVTTRKIKDPITVAMALGYRLTNDEWMWEKVMIENGLYMVKALPSRPGRLSMICKCPDRVSVYYHDIARHEWV